MVKQAKHIAFSASVIVPNVPSKDDKDTNCAMSLSRLADPDVAVTTDFVSIHASVEETVPYRLATIQPGKIFESSP